MPEWKIKTIFEFYSTEWGRTIKCNLTEIVWIILGTILIAIPGYKTLWMKITDLLTCPEITSGRISLSLLSQTHGTKRKIEHRKVTFH